MAKAKAKGKAAPSKRKGKEAKGELGSANKIAILLTCAALVPFSLPTLLLMFACLLPTLVAVVVEKGPHRYAWICVGGLNFSGLAPWLFKLWFGHHTLSYALDELADIKMLLISYGAAACGWLLYLGVPPVVKTFLAVTSRQRQDTLSSMQKHLIEQWGDGVSTSTSTPHGNAIPHL